MGVFSETLSLADLAAVLGAPSSAHNKGDPVSIRLGPDGPKRKHARWSLESKGRRQRRLEDQIEELVAFMEEHRDAFASPEPHIDRRVWWGVFSGETRKAASTSNLSFFTASPISTFQ